MQLPVCLALLLAFPSSLPAHPTASGNPGASVSRARQSNDSVCKNERFGFTFRAPKGWRSIALKVDEGWLAAKYQSDKTYFSTDKTTGYTWKHVPEMLCIAFVHENMKRQKVKTEETEEDGITTKTITINNPYKDYEDFLERTYAGGGWYVDSKKKGKQGKIEVTRYVVKVEKLVRTGPKRIITWVFHTPDIDFALQTEVLESKYKKLRSTVDRSLKSFKLIERSGDLLPANAGTSDIIRITRRELTEGTPKERRSKRMESQKHRHQKAVASLPRGWNHRYCGEVLVLDHDQERWAKRLGEHVNMLIEWMEKNFGYFGEGEFTRAPILRVCKDQSEEGAYSRGVRTGTSGSWVYMSPGSEIVTHKSNEGFSSFEVEWVNRMILRQWLADRNEDALNALPEWINIGLSEYISGAHQEGRKMEFRIDGYDRDRARLTVNQGKATPPRAIMRFTREEFRGEGGGSGYWSLRAEAAQLVRFMMSKEAQRCKQAKGLIEAYLRNLQVVVMELKEKEREEFKSSEKAETEEEEEASAKARADRWRKREQDMVREIFERTFSDWSSRDWTNFTKAYFNYIS